MSEQQSRAEQMERKRAYWKRQIENWRSSGETQIAFCQKHDLKPHQFTYWKKRFVQTETGITFVPLKIRRPTELPSATNTPPVRVIVAGDLQIEVNATFDPQLLRRLITTLRTLP